jgi:hypothetical protein
MAKASTQQASLIDKSSEPAKPAPTAAEIMKPRGWRREQRGGSVTAWRFDDPCGDYFLISATLDSGGCTTDADPAADIWTGGRYFDRHAPEGAAPLHAEIHDAAPLAVIVPDVLALPRQAPAPVFTPLEALRNLVLFHDGDSDFLAANRGTIADMPFGETSFQESLWQVARDVVATTPAAKESQK